MRQETKEDDRRCYMMKFLLLQEALLSRSQVKMNTAQDRDGIERPDSTLIFIHFIISEVFIIGHGIGSHKFSKLDRGRALSRC